MAERKETVLIVDAPSDRRSAAVMAYAKSPHVGKILITSGAGLLSHNCPNMPPEAIEILSIHHTDNKNILRLAQERKPDLIEVGQEDAIYAGVTDTLRQHNFLTFGVNRAVGKYEWNKSFARKQMQRHGADEYLPNFQVFKQPESGLDYIKKRFREGYEGKLFIKAGYPVQGKGVYGVSSIGEAYEAFLKLIALPNHAGRIFLVEDGVGGPKAEEFSGYFIGKRFNKLGYWQDHKPVNDNDQGLNTGGMGSVGPITLITPALDLEIKQHIVGPLASSIKDRGLDNRGIIYLGGMYDPESERVWNIEWNTRNGGSEAASNIPGLLNDYYEMARDIARGCDKDLDIQYDDKVRVAVAGTSLGYPNDYERVVGRKVHGLQDVIRRGEVLVLGAGIDDDFRVRGGRIFWLVAEADKLEEAIQVVYKNMEEICIPGDNSGENLLHYRRDIGFKELKRYQTYQTPEVRGSV